MKTKFFLLLLLPLFCALSCNRKELQARLPRQYSSEQLRNNVSVFAVGFNRNDSQILIGSNSSGIYNVYLLNVEDTTLRQLTHSTGESNFPVNFLYASVPPGREAPIGF